MNARDGQPDAERARAVADRIVALARRVPAERGADLLQVSTEAFCSAMGCRAGGRLEEVRDFVRLVTECMDKRGLVLICGCAYLSLAVGTQEAVARAQREGRAPMAWVVNELPGI